MAPARSAVQAALAEATVDEPSFSVLANVDAEPKDDPAQICQALIDQVDSPVQWVRIVQRLVALGVTHALEIGPGRVLAGLGRRIDKSLKVLSVGNLEAIDKVSSFMELEASN